MKTSEWSNYLDVNGDFELPKYLYKTNSELMKAVLDLGTLVCQDPAKLRAYKERVKALFKQRSSDMLGSLEFFGIVTRCTCREDDFCKACGGSRYILDSALTSDQISQISLVIGAGAKADIADKLQAGLNKALLEIDMMALTDAYLLTEDKEASHGEI